MTDVRHLVAARFSPRGGFTDRPIGPDTLRTLLEAARWSASSFNEQPWRFIVGERGTAMFDRVLGVLKEGNQQWAHGAAVLMITVAKLDFERNGKPNLHAWHDVGLAVGAMTMQAMDLGIYLRQMAGIEREGAREEFAIPPGFEPVTGLALGYQEDGVEAPERTRLAVEQITVRGDWPD